LRGKGDAKKEGIQIIWAWKEVSFFQIPITRKMYFNSPKTFSCLEIFLPWNIKTFHVSSFQKTKSDKMEVAKGLLKLREGEISQGKLPGIVFERGKFDELMEDLL
jgi:hypothetical protein